MNAVVMSSLDERVLATVRVLAPCRWSLLLRVLKVDREPLDLSLTRLQRQSVIIQTEMGFDLRGKRLPKLPDGNYSKDQADFDDDSDEDERKLCPHCKEPVLLINFYRSAHTKDGLSGWCKTCVNRDKQERRLRAKLLK